MRFNLISNINNGVGLEQDCKMLQEELVKRSHHVNLVNFTQFGGPQADVNIFLEVVASLYRLAPSNWLVPNPEWFFPHWTLTQFSRVLAKTKDSTSIFASRVNGRCRYIGWRARDLYRPEVKRERKFLHVAGKSQLKNTDSVVKGCALAGVELTVVKEPHRVSEEELIQLYNSHQFFLCPSASEGYGMALHEALGCGACVITTDAAPMNEIQPSLLIAAGNSKPRNFGMEYAVSPEDVAESIRVAMLMPDSALDNWRMLARDSYEHDSKDFGARLDTLLAEVQ
jgi:glycosyltransferase involved in cell wall biosynthesis